MSLAPDASFITIARIARTRGIRGELLADYHTDFPERFDLLEAVWLEFPDGSRERFILESVWEQKGRPVFKFAGVETIPDAQRLVGAWVQVDAREAVELPEGTYFDHDLIGCEVVTVTGERVGTVRDVMRLAGNHQLVVQGVSGEFMVPATDAICQAVLVKEKRIVVDLPEGLIDLNP